MDLRKGVMLGRYLLEESVGEGSEGRVFYALQQNAATERGLPCVLKVAKDLDEEGRQHFLEEARNAMKLGSCANIVSVIDADEVEGTPFFVMEYMDGIDLRRLLEHQQNNDGRPLPLPITYAVLKGIADGLHHAHVGRKIGRKSLGLIHRDVKPANTLITTEGRTKLLDFGIATRLDVHQSGRHLQGTFRYMSPEHVQGRICPAMDIYSLGVVAWEMLEGKAFRKGLSGEQILPLLLTETDFPPLQRTDLPAELVELVGSALSFDPAERPSAEEFSEALSECPGYVYKPKLVAERVQVALGREPRSRETEYFEIPEALRGPEPAEPTMLSPDDALTVKRPQPTVEENPTQHWRSPNAPEPDAPSLIRKPTKPLAKPIVHLPEVAPTEKLTEHQLFAQRTEPSVAAHRGQTEPAGASSEHPADSAEPDAQRFPWLVFLLGILLSAGTAAAVAWWVIEGGGS